MQRTPTSPERVSVALGLCVVMLATLPRYMAGGHETRFCGYYSVALIGCGGASPLAATMQTVSRYVTARNGRNGWLARAVYGVD